MITAGNETKTSKTQQGFQFFFLEDYYLDKFQSPWRMVDKSSLFNLAGYRLF